MRQHCLPFICIFLIVACKNADERKKSYAPGNTASVISCSGPQVTDRDWYVSGRKAPRIAGLEGIDFRVTTSSKEAQEYINQGLMLAYGFNHAEAARSFYEAGRIDSSCAMAYWGLAYVLGPNYNGGMEEDNFQRAYEASRKAKALIRNCSPREAALIEALTARYTAQPPADRSPLDSAYVAAMKKVFSQYPADPDIGALYAEAMMDLHPWDLYDKTTKASRPWTPELLGVLEHLMQLHPKHPGAHHFYIHALEASATPEKALQSAAQLEVLVPGSGHLVHMPSHIYINTGDYHLASRSNIRAIAVDSAYTTSCHAQGAYPLSYYPHNYHFLAATATLEGNSKLAWQASMQLQSHISARIMRQPGWGTLQHYYSIPYYVAAKLSLWDTILSLPAPAQDLVYPNAIWHYARGMAWLAKQDISNAQKEMDHLHILAADTTLQHLTVWGINTTSDLVQIASRVLAAGIAYKQNKPASSVFLLKEAVAIEDKLNYNEPPDWFFSVRHHLGAIMLKTGSYEAAAEVYRRDLRTWRKNGWALLGLYNALMLQKKYHEARKTRAAFEEAWQYADFKMQSSSGIAE